MKKQNGFTFIELLVVITIIGVIFAAGVVSYTTIAKNSRDARRRSDLESIRQALEMCRSITGVYPASIYPPTGSIICTDAKTTTMTVTPLDPKPDTAKAGCLASGQYNYVFTVATGTYTLTANCMENSASVTLKNP